MATSKLHQSKKSSNWNSIFEFTEKHPRRANESNKLHECNDETLRLEVAQREKQRREREKAVK